MFTKEQAKLWFSQYLALSLISTLMGGSYIPKYLQMGMVSKKVSVKGTFFFLFGHDRLPIGGNAMGVTSQEFNDRMFDKLSNDRLIDVVLVAL